MNIATLKVKIMINIKFTDGSNPYILTNERLLYKWFYLYDIEIDGYTQKNLTSNTVVFSVIATEKARRKTYQQAKEAARDFAINTQNIISGEALSYGFLEDILFTLYHLGKHFGLVREFRENCIC